jgi:hypothetical protein
VQRRSSFHGSQGGLPIRPRLALAAVVILALSGAGLAQNGGTPGKTRAQFAGGFKRDACRYPRQARAIQLSGCCQMDLEIGADGSVLKADGVCSDPIFLEPTRLCLSVQSFIPATQNGKPVKALQQLEYEWRATTPSKTNLCDKLRTS